MRATLATLVLPVLTLGAPQRQRREQPLVPVFFLAGDSTTAVDGGWGDGFLTTLQSPAFGLNVGKSGATTVSFVSGGYWKNVTDHVTEFAGTNDVYVTISFGHNDQKAESGINITQFKSNLINLGTQVKNLGGKPLYVSSLTRRVFPSGQPHNATDSLHNERIVAQEVAQETGSSFIDLNAASLNYINQIGQTEANKFNWGVNGTTGTDRTHLNPWGQVVFGRMVADLIQRELPYLNCWINENSTLSERIWSGLPPA